MNARSIPSAHSPNGQPLTLEQALINIRQTEDLGLRYYAAWWLGRMRVATSEAVDSLLVALEDESDRSPDGGFPLRRNAAKALGKMGDLSAVPALVKCLRCEDYYVRESAAQALEMLRDNRCVQALLDLLDGGVVAAVQVPGKPYLVQPYNAILEALGTLGDVSLTPIVEPFLNHDTPQVANAAARAMYQFTGQAHYAERLVKILQGDELQLRRSALMDLGAVGYVPAAGAIANTLAENSMKLIALKGILEHQLKADMSSSDANAPAALGASCLPLSETAQSLMQLMDDLL